MIYLEFLFNETLFLFALVVSKLAFQLLHNLRPNIGHERVERRNQARIVR